MKWALAAATFLMVGPAWAQENIALGASYTLDPAPNYEHSTDAADGEQLTDGVYTEGYFWTQLSTVGWQDQKPVIVTHRPGYGDAHTGGFVQHGGGSRGLRWPLAIGIFTAGEDRLFHEVGDLVELSAEHGSRPATEYGTHRYWTDQLRTHGRHVSLVVWNEPFTFVDEIEIYGGERRVPNPRLDATSGV